jgi:hypothetical protein
MKLFIVFLSTVEIIISRYSLQSFTFKEKSKRISTAIGARDLRFTEYLC